MPVAWAVMQHPRMAWAANLQRLTLEAAEAAAAPAAAARLSQEMIITTSEDRYPSFSDRLVTRILCIPAARVDVHRSGSCGHQ